MTDDTRTRLVALEVRMDEGLRAVRERVESRSTDSIRRFDAHAADDAKRFDKLDAKLDELTKAISGASVKQAALTAFVTVGGVVAVHLLWP